MAARTGHLGPTVFRSTDRKTWKEASQPPAFPKAPEGQAGLAVHHTFWLTPGHASEPNVWYAGSSPPGLFRSKDGGQTWESVPGFNEHPMRSAWVGGEQEAPPGGATLHSILIDPRDPKHMYLGVSMGGFFESTDQGANWRPLNKGCAADFIPTPDPEFGHDPHRILLHPLMPDRLYQQNHFRACAFASSPSRTRSASISRSLSTRSRCTSWPSCFSRLMRSRSSALLAGDKAHQP